MSRVVRAAGPKIGGFVCQAFVRKALGSIFMEGSVQNRGNKAACFLGIYLIDSVN